MAVVNNIPHTTYKVDEDTFDGVTLTVTCDDGYTFDGTPTIDYNDSTFGDEVTGKSLTVNSDNNIATITSDEIDASTIVINGSTKGGSTPTEPVRVNNVPNTAFSVDGSKVTLTCDDGFVFDGTPTITIAGSAFAEDFTVNSDGNIATYTGSFVDGADFTIDGNTKKQGTAEPTITNNVSDTQESHTVDGSNVTINLVSNKVMVNVNCEYTDTSGMLANVTVPVKVNVGVSVVSSTGEITLTDADFNKPITLTGEVKKAIPVVWTLSGCTSDEKPSYAYVGEVFAVVLKADTGNEFSKPDKVYIEPQGVFGQDKVTLTISEDKQTAQGEITPDTNDDELYVIGEATQVVSPVRKYGFINAYVVSDDNLEDFATKRFVAYTGSSSTDADPINYDLGDYVNRVKRFFFEVEKGTTTKLKCGNFVVDTDCYNLANDTKVISFGTVDVPNLTESSADYDADVSLFVPFVGVVSVGSEIVGKTIELKLSVNLLSGGGVYVLTCEDNVIWTQEAAPCTDVIYRTSAQDVKTIGGTNFDSSYLMGLQPYVMVTKKTIVSDGTQVSTDRAVKIADLTGYNKVTDVTFEDTTGMLQQDYNEIINTLRTGFTL